jgi:hypothetical protein
VNSVAGEIALDRREYHRMLRTIRRLKNMNVTKEVLVRKKIEDMHFDLLECGHMYRVTASTPHAQVRRCKACRELLEAKLETIR